MFDGSLWRQLNRTVSERDKADASLTALRRALARMEEDLDDDPLFARFCETLRRDVPRSITEPQLTIPIVETRSGKKVTFQDDDVKKSAK